MYVIIRVTDKLFVSWPGTASSYTRMLQHARQWPTRETAERERCPENERVISVDSVMGR